MASGGVKSGGGRLASRTGVSAQEWCLEKPEAAFVAEKGLPALPPGRRVNGASELAKQGPRVPALCLFPAAQGEEEGLKRS